MAERKPVVLVGGQLKELPAGDTLPPQAPASHSHATSDVTGLDAALSGKEPAISTGSTSQYWRGDKTWRDFFTDVRAATLTGLSTATNAVIDAADTVLVALGKLQAQVSTKANAASVREKLTAARTYYVRTDGNDSNSGLTNTAGGAFLTIQKAVDVASALDNGGYDITIQIANGTYSAGANLKSFAGSGRIIIQGNQTTPSSVHVSVASGACFMASFVIGVYEIAFLKMTSAASGNLVKAEGAVTSLILRGDVYGVVGGGFIYSHVYAQTNAAIDFAATNYEITGGAGYHIYTLSGGVINCNVLTCTLTGTPAFSGAFAYAAMTGVTRAVSNTYTGSATGKRYDVLSNGIVQTAAGETVLPGNAAGTTATGGLYI